MRVLLQVWPGLREALEIGDELPLELRVRVERRPGERPSNLLLTFRQTADDVEGVPIFQLVSLVPIEAAFVTS